MEITLINQLDEQDHTYLPLFETIAARCVKVLSLTEEYSVSVILMNDEMIHEINRTYRGIDRPTDVISFALKDNDDEYEMMEGEEELGDIFINMDAVKRQAVEYGHCEMREIGFLFTHGLLHLCGYDHMNEADEKEMFALQDVIIDEIIPRKSDC